MTKKSHGPIRYNEASSDRTPHLFIGESLGKRHNFIGDGYSFYLWPVITKDRGKDDRVLLDIYTRTRPNVMIGGNPLKIEVLEGVGKLSMLSLADGNRIERPLETGMRVEIPTDNVVYWFENEGKHNLLLRDTCNGFDPTNEPQATQVVQALSGLLTL